MLLYAVVHGIYRCTEICKRRNKQSPFAVTVIPATAWGYKYLKITWISIFVSLQKDCSKSDLQLLKYHVHKSMHSLQVELVNSSYAELVRVVNLVPRFMDRRDDVNQLVPSDDGVYVYALTAELVNYVVVHNIDIACFS